MEIIVIPPEIRKIDLSSELFESKEKRIFCGDMFFQEKPVRSFFGEKSDLFGIEDLGGECIYSRVNEYTRKFAREWFQKPSFQDVFNFKGINLAAQLIIAYTYYFLKVLKAVDAASVLLQAHYSDKFFLVDDKSVWAGAFKYIASEKNIKVNIIPCNMIKETSAIVETRQLVGGSKGLKEKLSIFTKLNIKKGNGNNIIYSAALRFAEPLWETIGRGKNNFFLRPGFSIKDYASCMTSKQKVKFLTVSSMLNARDEKECLDWTSGKDIWKAFEGRHPEIDKFFDYKGISIWTLIKEDLIFMVESSLLEGAKRVLFAERIFDRIDPSILIVEEDTCPFNKILVDCAIAREIPVVEILHGLLTNNVLSGMGKSSFTAVPGEYSRYKLRAWGVEDTKIKVTGSPHYQAKIKKTNFQKNRKRVRASFKISSETKFITVITNPFFNERNPYFVGSPLTPENTVKVMDTIIRFVEENDNVFIAVKIHPMDEDSWLINNIIEEKGLSKKIRVLSKTNTIDLLSASDLVLSGGSTVYLEALLLRVPILIFDDAKRPFWQDLRSEVFDLSSIDKNLEKIKSLLFSKASRKKRLEEQKQELKWHFVDENSNSIERFTTLINDSMNKANKSTDSRLQTTS